MTPEFSNWSLASRLRAACPPDTGAIARLKVIYRPFICPLGDLLLLVRPGERIADIGCGGGQFALLAATLRSPRSVLGLEIDPALVSLAQGTFLRAAVTLPHSFSVYSGDDFPIELEQCDRIFLIDVLHHVPPDRQFAFVEKLRARLRPGAYLVLKDIDAASPLVHFNRLHDALLGGGRGHELEADSVAALADRLRLRLVTLHRRRLWWYSHYTAILQAPPQP